jgi:hypothetical protein
VVSLECASLPAVPGSKYIDLYCQSYSYNSTTDMLTGRWGNNSAFSIHLVDTWEPIAIDDIEFHIVPEPGTVGLLALGGVMMRRRRR